MRADEATLKGMLIRGLEGDQVAYREFLSELSLLLRSYIHRQCVRLGRPDGDVEDIVQEALIAIHRRRHTYDRTAPATAWVYAIARYKLIDFLRATAHRAQDLHLDQIEEIVGDDEYRIETMVDIRKVVAALPARLRAPVAFAKLEGLSVAETAARIGTSEAAVKVNIHRGLRMLARFLG